MRSREHILLTNIIQTAWLEGKALDMAALIRAIQKPPMSQLGVFDLDSFYPAKERMELAMTLNAIIAAPAFGAWLKGEALDPARLFWTQDGRPRVSIFTLAHLGDRERAFFVTLLLDRLVAWMRAQAGLAGLRTLLYFDEVFGYLPPYPANPPTKRPMLTLLKQARAVGLGLVLATQNPVDLDYKALSNAGVWFVGRLQTERDKERLLDGLVGVQSSGSPLDRKWLDGTISALPKRTFLLHNVHRPGPQLFRTRWVMSYLSGPMTREQVRALMAPRKKPAAAAGPAFCAACGAALPEGARFCAQCGSQAPVSAETAQQAESAFKDGLRSAAAPVPKELAGYSAEPPILSAAIAQHYLPVQGKGAGKHLVYEPVALAEAAVSVLDQQRGVDHRQGYFLALEPPAEGHAARWDTAEALPYESDALPAGPAEGALFAPVPESLNAGKKLTALKRQLSDHLYVNTRVTLLHNPQLKVYSEVGEELTDFQRRARAAAEEARDEAVEKITARYETKLDRVEDRLRRERRDLSEQEAEHGGRKREEAISAAESVLGFLTGRRSSRALSQASRKRRMTERSRQDVEETEEQIEEFEEELEELKRELQAEIEEAHDQWAAVADEIKEFHVRPRRADVQIGFVGLGWRPEWRD